jgi:formylglycine-generating enzyme required for sulfatase activity
MTDVSAARDRKLKVFISCSCKDEDFAQDLFEGLEATGFEPNLDKHDIAAGEDWEARLGRLIEAADTVVFVISPDAVISERCAWEMNRTVNLKKRLLPIVWRRVEEAQVPPHLKHTNYIFFDRPLSFGASLKALTSTLKTDIAWVCEHARIGEAALGWERCGRAESLLLRGEELSAAQAWLSSQPKYAPEPTLLHHEFIKAGVDAGVAHTSEEQQRLEEIAVAPAEREKTLQREKPANDDNEEALTNLPITLSRGQLALTATAVLGVLIIVGVFGWFQEYFKEPYKWRVVMRPSVLTAEQEKEKAAKPGSAFKECANGCPTMIVVPAGTFIMGSLKTEDGRSNEEGPQHEVTITKPFAVGRTDLTFGEWDMCVAAGACPIISDNGWGRRDRPVINVSWEEAKGYVAWLKQVTGKDYRLLSEAEWEYSARAGNQGRWSFGDDETQLGDYAWFDQNSDNKTQPVARRKPNAFGLYDMHGNVWQWVEDPYHDNYDGAPSDGSVWEEGGDAGRRVLRGSAWNGKPGYLRSASRSWLSTGGRFTDSGFRVARTLTP